MVNEISSIGVGSGQGLGHTAGVSLGLMKPAATPVAQGARDQFDVEVTTRNGLFPAMASAKDDSAQAAKSVREAEKTLGKVGSLLNEMRQSVQVVKNYPPFPPGNEARVDYINSIEGLRKQLEALVVPSVDNAFGPVFYPKEIGLPELDPLTGDDTQVAQFSQFVEAAQVKLNASYAELHAQADRLVSQVGKELPMPPSDDEAIGFGATVAGSLAGISRPLVNDSSVLARLGD